MITQQPLTQTRHIQTFSSFRPPTDELGRTTTYEYDDRGRTVREVYPDPDGAGSESSPEMLYEYDLYDRVTSRTQVLAGGDNLVTTYGYDDLHRMTSETDPNGDETTYVYDFESNLLSLTDAVGNTTEYFYDDWDRQVMEIITVDGSELTRFYEYDLVGNLTKETQATNHEHANPTTTVIQTPPTQRISP